MMRAVIPKIKNQEEGWKTTQGLTCYGAGFKETETQEKTPNLLLHCHQAAGGMAWLYTHQLKT